MKKDFPPNSNSFVNLLEVEIREKETDLNPCELIANKSTIRIQFCDTQVGDLTLVVNFYGLVFYIRSMGALGRPLAKF
jgi:hypothetical protein